MPPLLPDPAFNFDLNMPAQRTSTLSRKSAELAIAAPQVVAHRLTRMALASPQLSARDRKEFQGMVREKQLAFGQAWTAMAIEAMRINQQILSSFLFRPWSFLKPGHSAKLYGDGAQAILAKGIAPVHKKAVANARRLARTRLK